MTFKAAMEPWSKLAGHSYAALAQQAPSGTAQSSSLPPAAAALAADPLQGAPPTQLRCCWARLIPGSFVICSTILPPSSSEVRRINSPCAGSRADRPLPLYDLNKQQVLTQTHSLPDLALLLYKPGQCEPVTARSQSEGRPLLVTAWSSIKLHLGELHSKSTFKEDTQCFTRRASAIDPRI